MTTRRGILRFLPSAAIAGPALAGAAPARGGLHGIGALALGDMVEAQALAGFYAPLEAGEPFHGAVEQFYGNPRIYRPIREPQPSTMVVLTLCAQKRI